MEDKEYFSDIKVGDRVCELTYGWGTIKQVLNTVILVCFDELSSNCYKYTFGGRIAFFGKARQTLFWDEVKIVPPEKPFDLETEYNRINIKPFCMGERNWFVSYSMEDMCWRARLGINIYYPNTLYYGGVKILEFVVKLNKRGIQPSELIPLILKRLNKLEKQKEENNAR